MTVKGMLKAGETILTEASTKEDKFERGSGGVRKTRVETRSDLTFTHEIDIFPKGEGKTYNIALPFSRKSTPLEFYLDKGFAKLRDVEEINFEFAVPQKPGPQAKSETATGSRKIDYDAAFDAFNQKYDVESYSDWGAAALCLKSAFPEGTEKHDWARERWVEWSKTGHAYQSGDEDKWDETGEARYSPLSFWYIAKDHGYEGALPFDKKEQRKLNAFAFLDTVRLLRDNSGEPIAQIADREFVPVTSEDFKNFCFEAVLRTQNEVADDANTIIEIDTKGWRVATDAPVIFRRGVGQELDMPKRGKLDDFCGFLNIQKDDMPFVLAWMVTAMYFPEKQCPILMIDGQAGSGKSSAITTVMSTIEPKVAMIGGLPKSEDDLVAATYSAGAASFDNLSTIAKMSDQLCRLSTGGGLSKRRLYTDNESVNYRAMKPLLLGGIDPTFYKQDLSERIMRVTLKKPDEYLEDEEFVKRVKEDRAGWLGAILDLVSLCMREVPDVREVKSRFATYVRIGSVIAKHIGYADGWFSRAAREKQEIEITEAALSDYVLMYVAFAIANAGMDSGEISANSKAWLDRMTEEVREGTFDAPLRDVPESPKQMGNRLMGAAPELEKRGIKVERGRRREFVVSWTHDEQAGIAKFLAEVNQMMPF